MTAPVNNFKSKVGTQYIQICTLYDNKKMNEGKANAILEQIFCVVL